MATPSVLAFDAEGRAIDFDVWVDDLQLFLQCDRADGLSLFDLTSGASPAPAADADATVRSQWATRVAAARLAVRRHLPTSERAHFSQYKSAQTLYDAVVARYSSPATAALSRLMLPYLFPDLAAFPTVADLITHLHTSDTRYRAALPAEFCAKNPPPMYITLYYIVTRLPDSLRVVRDHFLSVCPTTLTVDLLEKALLAAEKSIVAVGASRGDPRTPVFEGCSPSPLLPTVASAAVADLVGFESVGAASAPSRRCRTGKGKGGKGAGGAGGGGGGGGGGSGGGGGGGGSGGGGGGVDGGSGGGGGGGGVGGTGGGGGGNSGGGGGGGGGAGRGGAAQRVGCGGGQRQQQQQRTRDTPPPQQLREWYAARQRGGGTGSCTYVLRTSDRAGEQCGGAHSTQRCFGRLTDAWRHQFPEATEIPRWGELSRAGVVVFDLDFDAILAVMYAVTISDEGDCYRCFPPDPGIETAALGTGEAAALGASEAAALGARASAPSGAGESALSGTASASASHTFTLDSGASCSFFRDRTTLTLLGRPVAVSLADPSGGPVLAHFSTVLPCPAAPSGTLPGLYLPSFSTNLVSGADLQDAGVHQFTPASMASRVLVSGLPRSLPPGPGPTCVPCVEGRQRAAPHSSQFPPTEAPLQTLHMDVWGPARVRGQGHERYFLLVVDDYSRYTTVFPLRSKGDVTETITLPDSPQQNGIAEHRIGMVMDVSRWQFYHPTFRRFLSSQDVTFDESVPYYRLFPYRTPSLPPPPLFLVPGPPPVDPFPPQGPAPSGVSQVDAVEPVEVTGDSGAAEGAEPGGADSGGAERVGATPGGAEPEGATTRGVEPGGATTEGVEPGGAEPGGATPGGPEPGGAEPEGAGPARVGSRGARPGGSPGASSRREPLSPQEHREWFARSWRRTAGAGGSSAAESAGAAGPGGARTGSTGAAGTAGTTGAGAPEGVGAEATTVGPGGAIGAAVGPGGATGAAGGTGAGGAAGAGAAAGGTGAVPAVSGVATRPRPYFVPLLHRPPHCLLLPLTLVLLEVLLSVVSLRLALRRLSVLLALVVVVRSSLPALADPESDSLRAASPTVTRLLATVVTDPSFESTVATSLVAELVDFAARCRLDYAASLVAESESVCPPSVGDPDALDIPTPRSYAEAIEGPYSSQWQAAMDAEMASWKSTGTYVDKVPPPWANIVSGMWILRVKRPPGSPPVFKARYVARGFTQRQGVDYFQTFSPTPKMTTLRVLLHIAAHRDYELHSLDFSTAFLQGSLHEEIWLRRPPGFTGSFPSCTQWSLRRPVYGLR
ncbi:unnamed protein product [Closterium sp. NIES-64]|nr:unnamed protein product [Closterium sp. NIES-64]